MRSLVTVLVFATLCYGQSVDSRVWQVQFGTEGQAPLSVSSNGDVIEFRNAQAVAFTIPARSINRVFHTRQQVRRSTQAYNFFEGHCCAGTDSHLLSVLAFLVASPLGASKDEYVEIDWTEVNPGSVQLRLAPEDYVPFMDWVGQLSGVKPRDLEQERQEALTVIAQHASEAFPVSKPGSSAVEFEVLRVESGDDTLLYLFRGAVTPENLVLIISVTEEPTFNACVRGTTGKIVEACAGKRCEIRAVLVRNYTHWPGTLPRAYTVDSDGLAPSPCSTLGVRLDRPEDSARPSMRRSSPK